MTWPEAEWRRVCLRNHSNPDAAYNLQIRDLTALIEELDLTRERLHREQRIVDALLTEVEAGPAR